MRPVLQSGSQVMLIDGEIDGKQLDPFSECVVADLDERIIYEGMKVGSWTNHDPYWSGEFDYDERELVDVLEAHGLTLD